MSRRRARRCVISALALLLYGLGPAFAGEPLMMVGNDTFTFQISTNRSGCPEGSFSTNDSGSGHAGHLGAYTFIAGECISPDLSITGGFFTITAVRVDSISGNYSGTGEPADETGTSVIYGVAGLISGGTGRFQGVTGGFAFLGGATFTSPRLGQSSTQSQAT